MESDEREICTYLKSWPGQFISGREIARRAGGRKRFLRDPNWATPILAILVEKGVLESDPSGHFRLVPNDKAEKAKRWLSPQIRKILERSEKEIDITDPEEEKGEG